MIISMLAFAFFLCFVFCGKLLWIWLYWYKDSSYAENHSFLAACFHKGEALEMKISRYCDHAFAPSYTIANPYIEAYNSETTEIDVLFINTKGIFVFEAKNYFGWIFGDENARNWTQTLPQGKGRKAQKFKFFNPILQNQHHIKMLKDTLFDKDVYHSIIVFGNSATLKKVSYQNDRCTFLYLAQLKQYLKKVAMFPDVLTEDEIMQLYQRIHPMSLRSEAYKQEHIDAIRKKTQNVNWHVTDTLFLRLTI